MSEERQHDDAADADGGVQWKALGSFAPRIPPGPAPTGSAQRGPGGSLLEQLRRARTTRRAARPWPLSRPYRLVAAGAAALVLGGLVLALLDALVPVGAVLTAAGAAAAAAGGWVLRGDVQAEADLRAQVRRERQLARELDALSVSGWSVLHDRFLPGGHHRVAHLVVGPAGVFVVTPLPDGPLQLVGAPPAPGGHDPRQLYAGPVHLGPWLRARRWEIEQLEPALATAIQDAVWSGPTAPLAVHVPTYPAQQRSTAGVPDMPYDWDGVTLRPLTAVTTTLRGLPAPLAPTVVRELATTVDRLCPPAAPTSDQESSNRLS